MNECRRDTVKFFKYAFLNGLGHSYPMVLYSQDNTISQKVTDRLKTLCTADYFTNDLKYLIVRTIFNGNKKKFNKLMMIPEIVKMTMK